jgi:hypothetical protein
MRVRCRPTFDRLEPRRLLATWTGLGDGHSWDDKFNWDPKKVPGGAEPVEISSATVDLPHAATVGSLSMSRTVLSLSHTLTVTGATELQDSTLGSLPYFNDAGALQYTGFLDAQGALNIQGFTTLSDGITILCDSTGTLAGTVQFYNNGNFLSQPVPDPVFDVEGSATLTVGDDVTSSSGDCDPHLQVYGTLVKTSSGGGPSTLVDVDNQGKVDVQGGTLALDGAGVLAGKTSVADGAVLAFQDSASAYTALAGTAIQGAGTTVVDGLGTLSFDGNNTVSNLKVGPTGILQGPGDVTVSGTFEWSGGEFLGPGSLQASGTTKMDGANPRRLSGAYQVALAGSAVWSGSGPVVAVGVGSNNRVTILPGVSLEVTANESFYGGFLRNQGNLAVDGGAALTFASLINTYVAPFGIVTTGEATLTSEAGATGSGLGTVVALGGTTLDVRGNSSLPALDVHSIVQIPGVKGPGNLTVLGLLTWESGDLTGSGQLIAAGGLRITGTQGKDLNRDLEIAPPSSSPAPPNVWNQGNIEGSAPGLIHIQPGATLTDETTGTFEFDDKAPNPSRLWNSGTFHYAAAPSDPTSHNDFYNAEFDNAGQVSVDTGLYLTLYGCQYNILDGSTGAGSGTVYLFNPVVGVSGNAGVGNLTASYATLSGSGELTSGNLQLRYDTWLQDGQVTFAGNTTIDTTSSTFYLDNFALDNVGQMNWLSGRIQGTKVPSTWTNDTQGTFSIQGDNPFFGDEQTGGSIQFTNNGLMVKSGTSGNTLFTVPNFYYGGLTVTNKGTIDVKSGTLSLWGVLSNYASQTLTGGTYVVEGSGRLFIDAPLVTNDASVILDGPSSDIVWTYFADPTGAVDALSQFSTNGPSAQLTVRGARAQTLPAFTNAGLVAIDTGASVTTPQYVQRGGTTQLEGGTLASTKLAEILAGDLTGTGTVVGNLSSSGIVSPGDPTIAGLITIQGDYAQTTSGALDVGLGGTVPAQTFDQLAVTGAATLSGTLNVTRIGGFAPNLGQSFAILTFASSTGDFATKSGLDLGGGNALIPVYHTGDLTLVAATPVHDVSASVAVTRSGFTFNRATGRFSQTITIKNTSGFAIGGPISLVLDNLTPGVSLFNAAGTTVSQAPTGSPYINFVLAASGVLAPGGALSVVLQFTDPARIGIHYATRVLAGYGSR